MLDHVSITVSDMARAAKFYDAVFAALGQPCVRRDGDVLGYGLRSGPEDDGRSSISIRATGKPIPADRRHWCFRAPSRAAVDGFHGAPGLRANYHELYYAAFLIDPDAKRLWASLMEMAKICLRRRGVALSGEHRHLSSCKLWHWLVIVFTRLCYDSV